MIKLLDILTEAIASDHYLERKNLRGNILDVILPRAAYDGYDLDVLKTKLIPQLKQGLLKKLKAIEGNDFGESNKFFIGKIVFRPFLEKDGNEYPIKIVISSESKTSKGETYYVIISDNKLVTFILAPSHDISGIERDMNAHNQRLGLKGKPTKIISSENDNVVYNIRSLFGEEIPKEKESKININSLPYIPKLTYRPGSTFNHKKFGTGKITTATSGGSRSGDPDNRGIVDQIEVDFGNPYVSGGKLHKTRKLEKIYTSQYFK